MLASIGIARQVVPLLTGPSFARDQVIDEVNGVPFIAHDYAGGPRCDTSSIGARAARASLRTRFRWIRRSSSRRKLRYRWPRSPSFVLRASGCRTALCSAVRLDQR